MVSKKKASQKPMKPSGERATAKKKTTSGSTPVSQD